MENIVKADTFSPIADEHPFEATIEGLESARRACRFQMVKIVKEVDTIEKHPEYATDEKRPEAIQSTITFRRRLPAVKDNEGVPCTEDFWKNASYPSLLEPVGDGVTEAEATKPPATCMQVHVPIHR